MSIYEYDEEEELRKIRAGEREIGEARGQLLQLISLVCKKLQKGKSNEQIANELEDDLTNINRICEAAIKFAPDYDVNDIYNELNHH